MNKKTSLNLNKYSSNTKYNNNYEIEIRRYCSIAGKEKATIEWEHQSRQKTVKSGKATIERMRTPKKGRQLSPKIATAKNSDKKDSINKEAKTKKTLIWCYKGAQKIISSFNFEELLSQVHAWASKVGYKIKRGFEPMNLDCSRLV